MACAVVRVWWQFGLTALMWASWNCVEAMKILIDKGADVNVANVSAALAASIARTAVWRACGHGG